MYFFEKNTCGVAQLKLVAADMASHVPTNASSGEKFSLATPSHSQRAAFMTSCLR